MNYSLNFLTKKDESNNKIIENFKETEKNSFWIKFSYKGKMRQNIKLKSLS